MSVNIEEVLTFSTPRQVEHTINMTINLFNREIKKLTGRGCDLQVNDIKTLKTLRIIKNLISRELYKINPTYRFDVEIQYTPDPEMLKSEKLRCLREAITILKNIHKKGYAHNDVQLEYFVLDDMGNIVITDKSRMKKSKDRQNDFDVFGVYLAEIVYDNPQLQYLEDEFLNITSL
jgi:DNA replication protein DnaD